MTKRPTPTLVPMPSWRSLLRMRGPNAIADFRNVMIVLRNEPGFATAFAFDEMQQAVIVRAPPPICGDAQPGAACPRFADEEDVSRLQEWMQMVMPKVGRETIHWALEDFARENPVHPLRLMLRTREIGVRQPVLENWLCPALGVPNDAYHREVGRRFAIAMVARIMEPGCQCDYMLVLEGPQGEMKSQFCRALAGPEYFSDHVPDLRGDQVRMSMHFRGKWLVEFSDLAAFRGAEVELLKATITRRVEIYTPKYGRKERHEPRQCLFIGTTNVDDWIKDETGGRRFWPVKVVQVDLDWLAEYRDQLLAEAVEAYDAGEPWWPDKNFERRVIAPQQDKRQAFDNWTDRVLELAHSLPTVTIALIWNGLGSITHGGDLTKLDMLASKRIANILKKDGYVKGYHDHGRIVWRKPEKG
jgi:predicted P-loop ATPase